MGNTVNNNIEKTKIKNFKMNFFIVSLLFIIIVASVIGIGAYAMYITMQSDFGTVQVAKWVFNVKDKDGEQFESINLAKTIINDVTEKVASERVAPGTYGAFDIVLDGEGSEVAIDYYININKAGTDIPKNLKFYRASENFSSDYVVNAEDLKNPSKFYEVGVTANIKIAGEIKLDENEKKINKKVTERIYWFWPYETGETQEDINNNDEIDKLDSQKGNIIVPIRIVVEQKDKDEQPLACEGITLLGDNNKTSYSEGEKLNFQVNYNQEIFGSPDGDEITVQNAPKLKIKFGSGVEKTATYVEDNVVANLVKVASINNVEKMQKISAVAKGKKSLKYEYSVLEEDSGSLKIVELSGKIFNKKGMMKQGEEMEKPSIVGGNILAFTLKQDVIELVSLQGESVIKDSECSVGDAIIYK